MTLKEKRSQLPPVFLFVNEDANTVNRTAKDPALDRKKQSHVQRHNFAKRKQLKDESLLIRSGFGGFSPIIAANSTEVEKSDPVWSSFDAYLSSDLPSQPRLPWQLELDIDPSPHHVKTVGPQDLYEPGHFFKAPPACRRGKNSTSSAADFQLTGPPLQGRAIHPLFSGSAKILEKWAPPLIQYFNTVIIPEKFPTDVSALPLGQIRHAAAIHADCLMAMSEPVHLYAFLAEATTRMLDREGTLLLADVKEQDHHRVHLFFKAKAMAALRNALTGGLNHALVADVHRLIAASYFTHDYEAAIPHVDALVSMIETLGGIETFGDYFQETVLLADWAAALKTLGVPRLGLDWDPQQGSTAIAAIQESLGPQHDDLGKRMLSIFAEGQLRREVSDAFQDMVRLIRFRRWTMSQPAYDPEHYRYALLRHTTIGCRLLLMGDNSTKGTQEEAFRVAMIFWTALTRSPASGKRCASLGVGRLRGVLESMGPHSWDGHYDWLLWIAVVGGLTATSDDNIDWFASLAIKATKALNNDTLMDLAEMENILSGFLYEPLMQRGPLLDFRARMRTVNVD